jgi:hypothetical protein
MQVNKLNDFSLQMNISIQVPFYQEEKLQSLPQGNKIELYA